MSEDKQEGKRERETQVDSTLNEEPSLGPDPLTLSQKPRVGCSTA